MTGSHLNLAYNFSVERLKPATQKTKPCVLQDFAGTSTERYGLAIVVSVIVAVVIMFSDNCSNGCVTLYEDRSNSINALLVSNANRYVVNTSVWSGDSVT